MPFSMVIELLQDLESSTDVLGLIEVSITMNID